MSNVHTDSDSHMKRKTIFARHVVDCMPTVHTKTQRILLFFSTLYVTKKKPTSFPCGFFFPPSVDIFLGKDVNEAAEAAAVVVAEERSWRPSKSSRECLRKGNRKIPKYVLADKLTVVETGVIEGSSNEKIRSRERENSFSPCKEDREKERKTSRLSQSFSPLLSFYWSDFCHLFFSCSLTSNWWRR